MLPKLQPSKTDTYPKDTPLHSSNILKLKLIQQFLEQRNTSHQPELQHKKAHFQPYDKENSHRRQNSTLVKKNVCLMEKRKQLGLEFVRRR